MFNHLVAGASDLKMLCPPPSAGADGEDADRSIFMGGGERSAWCLFTFSLRQRGILHLSVRARTTLPGIDRDDEQDIDGGRRPSYSGAGQSLFAE